MRLWILAIGHMRGTPEGMLVEDFCDRARKLGRNLGFPCVSLQELSLGRERDRCLRTRNEAERLASQLPEGCHIIILDARGRGMTSEDFAEMLASLRDVGTRDLAFVIGGPDGLGVLPGKKPGRSLAFGPQTWPHLLVRVLLAEQIYRAFTILSGHPYHRA